MLVVDSVSHSYGQKTIINNTGFRISPGEMVFITGSSGAGKSTLLRLLSGSEIPSYGNIFIGGYNTKDLSSNERLALRREVATIFQDPLLLRNKTIKENISMPLEILGYDDEYIEQRTFSAMRRLGLLDGENQSPAQLSVGQQQRVSVARALVNHPNIVLADEPTGNLDYQASHDIVTLLKRFQARGTTVVIVSHDLKLISDFGDRTLMIDHGEVIADIPHVNSVEHLYSNFHARKKN